MFGGNLKHDHPDGIKLDIGSVSSEEDQDDGDYSESQSRGQGKDYEMQPLDFYSKNPQILQY